MGVDEPRRQEAVAEVDRTLGAPRPAYGTGRAQDRDDPTSPQPHAAALEEVRGIREEAARVEDHAAISRGSPGS